MNPSLGFVHRYVPPPDPSAPAARVTLLLLHGTGGNEEDLLPIRPLLLPGATLLSPRGQVLEHGMPRFFRRLAEGVFDQEDLARRTDDLKTFIRDAATAYRLDPAGIVAVGFSNGANIAASVLLRHPGTLRRAVLLSPMLPFEMEEPPALAGTEVFIGAGEQDAMVPRDRLEPLVALLRAGGAEVTVRWDPAGHTITPGEIAAASEWLKERLPGR
ncbi:MAG TPA: alpha/beta hydrolase [Candidatus Eisenbacteria bacterium]|nr:alpha/beta hydrolase [Candidatus Eisenbacteria bacterium]